MIMVIVRRIVVCKSLLLSTREGINEVNNTSPQAEHGSPNVSNTEYKDYR